MSSIGKQFNSNFRNSIESTPVRVGSNKKLNQSKTILNSTDTKIASPSATNCSVQAAKAAKKIADLNKAKSYLKKHLERYDNQQPKSQTSAKNATNFSSFRLKNSTDFLLTNSTTTKAKLSASINQPDIENQRQSNKQKFNRSVNDKSIMSNSSNSFLLDDLSNIIVSIETDQQKVQQKQQQQPAKKLDTSFSTASSSNNNILIDQMASFIEELKDFIDDRLIDTTSQLEIANKRINDLYNGISYLTHELISLKYQNQELKQEILKNNLKRRANKTRTTTQSKPVSTTTSDSVCSLMNHKQKQTAVTSQKNEFVVYECNPIYIDKVEQNNSQGSSINFYDNMFKVSRPKTDEDVVRYRTSSQIDFVPASLIVNPDEEEDNEVKQIFPINHLDDDDDEVDVDVDDDSNIELSSSSTNEENTNNNQKTENILEESKKLVIGLEPPDNGTAVLRSKEPGKATKLLNHLHTSMTPFANLINDFDAQYSWDYTDNNNLALNKIKK